MKPRIKDKEYEQENAERSPQLPTHDQSTSDTCRCVLSGVRGNCRGLGAHTDTEQETTSKELLPTLCEAGTDDGDEAEDGGDEDASTATEPVVEWISQPTTTARGKPEK